MLIIVLIGIIMLAAISTLLGGWGLTRVRDRAIADNADVLEQRTRVYLLRMAQERAEASDQRLQAIQQLTATSASYLSQIEGSAETSDTHTILDADHKWRYFHGKTTILLPADPDPKPLLAELVGSERLNELFSGLARATPEIARISYMTPSGTIRTFPQLPVFKIPDGWSVQKDVAFQAALPAHNPLRKVVWTAGVHPLVDDLGQYGKSRPSMVISAVAPVYRDGVFKGAVIADVSRDRLAASLGRLGEEQTGFAFLLDEQGHLAATSKEGELALAGKSIPDGELSGVALDQVNPTIAPIVADMHAGNGGSAVISLNGRPHILAYAPIGEVKWSIGLAVPLDEIVVDTSKTAAHLTDLAGETRTYIILASLAAVAVLGLIISYVLRQQFMRPLTALVEATRSIAAGNLCPIEATRGDELGQLARAFNTMTESLSASRYDLTAANQQLELKIQDRTADLNMAVTKLEETFANQQELLRALREVSTPVIPVVEGALAMPLVGQIDEERARNMTATLLGRIERDRARTVLLDITGVPVIDTQVAQSLIQMVSASRLLGAEVVLVGVAPEVAQTIVTLGIDLRGLHTAADLRSAVERLLARRRAAAHPLTA
jgi:anti-anti-sigma regulatory factor/HAMP domain-containing protein